MDDDDFDKTTDASHKDVSPSRDKMTGDLPRGSASPGDRHRCGVTSARDTATAAPGQSRRGRGALEVTVFVVALVAVAGGTLYSLGAVGKTSTSLFYDRFAHRVYELDHDAQGKLTLRRVWPTTEPNSKFVGKIDYDVRRVDSHLIVTERMEAAKEIPFLAGVQSYTLYSPNAFGGYDLAGFTFSDDQPGGTEAQQEEVNTTSSLAQWKKGYFPKTKPAVEVWIPIEDPKAINILKTAYKSPSSGQKEMEQLADDHRHNPLYPVFALDLAVAGTDESQVHLLLARYEARLAHSGRPLFEAAPRFYHTWLTDMKRDREGRNLATRLMIPLDRVRSKEYPGPDLPEVAKTAALTRYDDEQFIPDVPLLLPMPPGSQSNVSFLALQISCKAFLVLGEFRLFQGDADGALSLLTPWYRIGNVLMKSRKFPIDALIGIAIRAISIQGIQTTFLDGMRTPGEIQRNWPLLDKAYQADLTVSKDPVFADSGDVLYGQDWIFMPENRTEALTRNLTTHARMALAHSATAARYHLLTTGRYPADASDFGPLLPGGADPDPFEDFKKPLRIGRTKDRPFVLYSIGPDRADQHAELAYDPTNGSVSSGDLFTEVPLKRKYPFPAPGKLATTRDALLAQFPNGLPPDPFADVRLSSYAITDTTPAWILSWGPDTDQRHYVSDFTEAPPIDLSKVDPGTRKFLEDIYNRELIAPVKAAPGPRYGVSTYRSEYIRYPNLVPGVAYDPTNGAVSDGNLYFCTGAPKATMLLHNLPPTPTPFATASPTPSPTRVPTTGNPFGPR